MAENSTVSALSGLNPALTTGATKKEKNEQIDGSEFIHLLVTQLKHQDPLEPMDNGEFAVQLAQFSQVEQLVSINDKLDAGPLGQFSSMAAYLGHEVTLNTDSIEVKNGDGGSINFDLAQDASEVEARLLDADGNVQDTLSLGELKKGKYTVRLTDLTTAAGQYKVELAATGANGGVFQPEVHAAGIVSGIIPGPEPKLLVDDKEISPSEVIRVSVPPAPAE